MAPSLGDSFLDQAARLIGKVLAVLAQLVLPFLNPVIKSQWTFLSIFFMTQQPTGLFVIFDGSINWSFMAGILKRNPLKCQAKLWGNDFQMPNSHSSALDQNYF